MVGVDAVMVAVPSESFIVVIEQAFRERGVNLARVGLAWARASPAVMIVPAFGLKALPATARIVLAVALAAAIFPALPPVTREMGPYWVALLGEAIRGLPIALAAAIPLWAATMAGGVADTLRGSNETRSAPTLEGDATPMAIALSLLAGEMFLVSGGVSRVAAALAKPVMMDHPMLVVADDLAGGIGIAVAIGAPLLAASIVIEVAGALIARAATPAQLHQLLAPLRALALLAVFAVALQRMSEVLAAVVVHARL